MEADGFERIVGADSVRVPPERSLDGVPVPLVVSPGSAAEVAACLGEASARQAAIVATGGGSKLGWGNRPRAAGVICLDLTRLSSIESLDADEGVATVSAGARAASVEAEARARGKQTLLDASHPTATVGGVIAADAFGPEVGVDRRLRNDLLGLQVALSDGRLTRCGGRVVKNVTGFDLVRLYCGSLGTLGVITEATLRLRPLPERCEVLGREFGDWEAAVAGARELTSRAAGPAAAALHAGASGVELLWRLEGTSADVAARARRVEGESRGESDWEQVRRARANGAAEARIRLAARSSDTLALVEAIREVAGEGAAILALPLVGIALARVAEETLDPLLARATRARWSVLVERASAEWKSGRDVFGAPPETLPVMRSVKQRFDPHGVLAPGRFVGGI